jgi:acyl-CoA reductase-like NAD-dependent aldehyde dehydrogenase
MPIISSPRLLAAHTPTLRDSASHGGVVPVIDDRDVELDQAIAPLANGGFHDAGQVCISVQPVYADRRIAEPMPRAPAKAGATMRVGDPTNPETAIGSLIRRAVTERVHACVQEAIVGGARLFTGREALSETCYAPTVLLDPPEDARLGTQGVFGPVIAVCAYDDPSDAIRHANALPFAFHAAASPTASATYRQKRCSCCVPTDSKPCPKPRGDDSETRSRRHRRQCGSDGEPIPA